MVEKSEIGIYLLKIFYKDICLRAKTQSRHDETVPLVWKVIRFVHRYLKGCSQHACTVLAVILKRPSLKVCYDWVC